MSKATCSNTRFTDYDCSCFLWLKVVLPRAVAG